MGRQYWKESSRRGMERFGMDWSDSGQGLEAGCCDRGNEHLGSIKCGVLIWLAEELLASQEGLWFTESVSQSVSKSISQSVNQSVSQSVSYPGSQYNMVLRIIFLPKSEQVTGSWRQWQNKTFIICRLQKTVIITWTYLYFRRSMEVDSVTCDKSEYFLENLKERIH